MKYEKYLTFDDPIPYKNLLVNPVRMRDYYDFHECVLCLLVDKNSVPDIEVISMSYFEYLISLGNVDKRFHLMLDQLIRLILTIKKDGEIVALNGEDDVQVSGDCKSLILSGVTFTSEDFDNLKNIILLQNEISPIDETTSKEVRELLQDADEYKRNKNGQRDCDLEDRFVAISSETGLSMESLYGMTIRKFNKLTRRTDHIMHYKIYLSGIMSGNITMKDNSKLKHWLADLNISDKFEDAKFDYDEAQNKFGKTT